jgi:AcrR family transcriptional regulator
MARKRTPLNRQRVLAAAVGLADRDGIDALSMRKLGAELGVEAMSLYNHVSNKDDLLDGIVDEVASEFEDPGDVAGADWRAVVRRCAMTEHEVLLRHPWVAMLAESRVMTGPVRLRYYDALLGVLRGAGFSALGAYRANLVLDSYVYGFTLQEVAWPAATGDTSEMAAGFLDRTARAAFPNLVEVAELGAGGQIEIGTDFEVGLDAVLESLDLVRERS